MSRLSRRTEYTFWMNDEPYTSLYTVLELLAAQSQTYEPHHLHRCDGKDGFDWEIVVPWYSHGCSGGDQSGHHYYQFDPAIAERLVEYELVTPHKEVGWGYTTEVKDKLVISSKGSEELRRFMHDMRTKAESLLKPGVHTDLTGTIDYRGYSRDDHGSGPLHFLFEMPTGGRCRVYPEEEKIVLPEVEAAA